MKFGKDLEIWKRFGNLEKVWKFGKGLEILKKKNWKIWQKKNEIWKQICKLGEKIGNLEKNWKFGKKNWKFGKLEIDNWMIDLT